jgi:outer membrane protein assembly factor BamB
VWQKNILRDYGVKEPQWSVTQSPLLYKDMVIVAPQGEVGVAAFDAASGDVKWESGPVGPMDYASPMLRTIGGVDQVTIVNREGVRSVAAAGGQLLWTYDHRCRILVPPTTDMGDGRFFVTGGYNAGSAVIRVTKGGGGFEVEELATIDKVGSHLHPGLFHEGHVYALCNTNERRDGLVCFDPQLKIVWQTERDPNLDKGGSILTADGLIYIMDGAKGDLHIVEPSAAGFKSLDSAKLLGGKEIWGPLALSDGYLVIRDQREMKCVDIKPGR